MQHGLNYHKTKVSALSYEVTMTIDCAIFGYVKNSLSVLLAKRATEPFKDHWLLPGGVLQEGLTLEDTAHYVLKHLVDVSDVYIQQVGVYSDPDRHPVKRVVTAGFFALVKPENHAIVAREYISEVRWVPLEEAPKLGFDHSRILEDAVSILRERIGDFSMINELLAEKFTMSELQNLYEIIKGEKVDRRNFRRRLENLNYLKATNEKKPGIQGGPKLYVFNDEAIHSSS